MLFFKKRYQSPPDCSLLGADIHSHLLPGIDDGSPTLETSLDLIRGLEALGFSKLITTPHVMSGMYPNTPQIIQDRLTHLLAEMKVQGRETVVAAAAEYFMDEQLAELIPRSQDLLPIGKNYLLCEFSMLSANQQIKKIVFDLQLKGFQVIIAHPERYIYLEGNRGFYDELKDMGCYFQLNLLSLGSYYGKTVQSLAQYLSRKRYYDFAGTDLHNHHQLELLADPAVGEELKRLMDTCTIRNADFL